jgi:hypothetical protein
MGETAPNAVLYGGDRPPARFYMGETAPNAVLSGRLIEKLSLYIEKLVSYL